MCPPPPALRWRTAVAKSRCDLVRNRLRGWCPVLAVFQTKGRAVQADRGYQAATPENHYKTHKRPRNLGLRYRRRGRCAGKDNRPGYGLVAPHRQVHPADQAMGATRDGAIPEHADPLADQFADADAIPGRTQRLWSTLSLLYTTRQESMMAFFTTARD
jgi:hypothetical protein